MERFTKSRSYLFGHGILALVTILAVVGCGGGDAVEKASLFPASGNLTLDGKPFGPATLRFVPDGTGAAGLSDESSRGFAAEADADGKIESVTTYETGDGAPSGTYTVTAISTGGPSKPIPAIYESETRSPLKVTIAEDAGEDANKFTIALESKAGKPNPNSTFRGIDPGAASAGVKKEDQ